MRPRHGKDDGLHDESAPMKPPAYAAEFLASCGWKDAEILPLAGDASFRRYFRVDGIRGGRIVQCPASQPASLSPDCRGVLARSAAQ